MQPRRASLRKSDTRFFAALHMRCPCKAALAAGCRRYKETENRNTNTKDIFMEQQTQARMQNKTAATNETTAMHTSTGAAEDAQKQEAQDVGTRRCTDASRDAVYQRSFPNVPNQQL